MAEVFEFSDDALPPPPPPPVRTSRVALLFLLLAAAVFSPALFNEYTHHADMLITRTAGAEFSALWSPADYGTQFGQNSWRPLGSASFLLLDVMVFRQIAALSHALAILLHFVNAILLFGLLRYYSNSWDRRESALAAVAAATFLVHPLASEVVYSAAFRFDQLALTFLLLGLHVASRHDIYTDFEMDRQTPTSPIFFAVVFMVLGLGFHENVLLLVLLAPLALWLTSGNRRRTLQMTGALAAVGVAFGFLWLQFGFRDVGTRPLGDGGVMLGVANFLVAASEIYLPRVFWPWPLRIDHDFVAITAFSDLRLMAAGATLAVVGVAAGALAWRDPVALFGLAWIVITLLPVAGFVPLADPIAERYCYAPLAGAALIWFAFLRFVLSRNSLPRTAVIALGALVIVPFAVLSHMRGHDWRNEHVLQIANWHSHDAEENPRAQLRLASRHLMRAGEYSRLGEDELAATDRRRVRALLQALDRTSPANPEAGRLLVILHMQEGDLRRARQVISELHTRHPDNAAVAELHATLHQTSPAP